MQVKSTQDGAQGERAVGFRHLPLQHQQGEGSGSFWNPSPNPFWTKEENLNKQK